MMENLDFATTLINYGGIGIALVYFMVRDYKFMGQLQSTLTALEKTCDTIMSVVSKEKRLDV